MAVELIQIGIVCFVCRRPVVEIEKQTLDAILFRCPSCGCRWMAQEPGAQTCECADGWTCEQHPGQPWPHGDCAGPGQPCTCMRGRLVATELDARYREEPGAPKP